MYNSDRVEQLFAAALKLPEDDREPFLRGECGPDAELFHIVMPLLAAERRAEELDWSISTTSTLSDTCRKWMRAITLLAESRDYSTAERDAFLADACAGDPELKREIENLLSVSADSAEAPGLGARVGSYRIERELGRGGMGTVFLAERDDGQFDQKVALKVMNAGALSPSLTQRFIRERQILARLNHPGIARLLDGGITAEHQLYLVMEYVEGVPIDVYCTEKGLGIRERLVLFVAVCRAVQSAHQSLIVHRDIKPANILVTGAGTTKLLDFGIARVLAEEDESAETDTHTRHTRVLTPAFASPEQARGEPVGTPADIYSLGALLYKLLTGKNALESGSGSLLETLRAVQETEPARPSLAASDAQARRTLRGDLDRIILHALQKEPGRRYSSAEALAADVQRYLDGFPVLARGDSAAYRAGKFIRRNKTLVASMAVIVLVIAVSLAAVLRSAAVAERRFAELRQYARFVVFDVESALQGVPGSLPVRQMIVQRSQAYYDRLFADASSDASLKREVANGYMKLAIVQGVPGYGNLGKIAASRSGLSNAIGLYTSLLAANPGSDEDLRLLAHAYNYLGGVELGFGSPAAAFAAHKKALADAEALVRRRPHPPGRWLALLGTSLFNEAEDLGGAMANLGDPGAALPLYRRALEAMEREAAVRQSEPKPEVNNEYRFSNQANVEVAMARTLDQLGQRGEALRHCERALELLRMPGVNFRNNEIRAKLLFAQYSCASLLMEEQDSAAARPLISSAQRIGGELVREDPENWLLQMFKSYADGLAAQERIASGDAEGGFRNLDDLLKEDERLLHRDESHAYFRNLVAVHNLEAGDASLKSGRNELARQRYLRTLEISSKSAAAHPDDASARLNEARAHRGLARYFTRRNEPEQAAQQEGLAREAAEKVMGAHPANPTARKLLSEAPVS